MHSEALPSGSGSDGVIARVKHLALRDFRNLARVSIDVGPSGMVVVGDNGQGKSNLLEAIYYLHLLRSARGARDRDLVHFGAPAFHIAARCAAGAPYTISAAFELAGKRKKIAIDDVERTRLVDALGALPSVMLAPRDVALVAGSPSERRRYIDVVLALTSRRYLAALQHYRAALMRRNAALRESARHSRPASRVAVWEPALAEHGAHLWCERWHWIVAASGRFAELCKAIGERGESQMGYASSLSVADDARGDEEAVRGALGAALEAQRAHDLRRGVTHAGPHRDDIALVLEGRPYRLFASAGQQRTAAIALRLLEAETLRDRGGRVPIVLLDDPFAELDARRAGRILSLLSHAAIGQTILAVPRADDIPRELLGLDRWTIDQGVMSLTGAENA